MSRAKGDLLGLCEVLIRVPVELKLTNVLNGHELFGPDLRGIKDVEFEFVFVTVAASQSPATLHAKMSAS